MILRLAPLFLLLAAARPDDTPPLMEPAQAEAIAAEVSGTAAKRTVQALSLHHRMRGSEGYRAAAEAIRDRLKAYGLSEVEIISLPADGKIFYGTQRSRPAWNAEFAELWERRDGRDSVRIASWADQPITLAQDSVSGRADAPLVDIGAGTSPADYEGKEVRGRLVLTSSQPEAVAKLALTERGAAGIVSWAQNQRSAWWGEDESLIRWGHLSTWEDSSFAFMVSPAQARAWQARLAKGETVTLRAEVKAGRTPGAYLIPTAIIPGREPGKEIVFSCHLDHPSPGANDDASGCAGILEIARSLQRLVREKKLPQPKRTLRFVWPCEIECTIALLNARPEFARRALATIHLDMIGGNTEVTKGNLAVEGPPPSLPSFVPDVGFAIARWVDAQATRFADTGAAALPLVEADGTKQPLRARIGGFSEGSDHQIWAEGSWRIPVINLRDWPDIYIHTNRDVPENLDSTKMKRAIFIAAASAWVLANLERGSEELTRTLAAESGLRSAEATMLSARMERPQSDHFFRRRFEMELAAARGLADWGLSPRSPEKPREGGAVDPARPEQAFVYRRSPKLKGPMNGFGYSWLDEHLKKAGLPRPALLSRQPLWGGVSYGYEALNLVDGDRMAVEIANDLSATLGPVPVEEVTAFLTTLERLGVVQR